MLSTTGRRLAIAISAVLGSCVMAVSFGPPARAGAGALPDSLSTSAFWALSTELSEPNGYFQSDNLVSNEIQFQRVIPDLTKSARAGRVYLGVGPEQNFSYIAALKPAMVFIVDVRRGNLQLHLMYKALFELSTDRADFVSRLFSKKRPAGLTAASTAQDIFAAYEKVETDDENLYKANLTAIDDHLVKTRGLQLTEEDLEGDRVRLLPVLLVRPVHSVLVDGRQRARRANGSDVRRSDDGRGRYGARPELPGERGELRTAEGARGQEPARPGCRQLRRHEGASRRGLVRPRSRRDRFGVLRLERRTVSGAQRDLGTVLRATSRRMPMDESSTFIRSVRSGNFVPGVGLDSELGNMVSETKSCGMTGAARLLFRSGVLGRPLVAQPPAPSRR